MTYLSLKGRWLVSGFTLIEVMIVVAIIALLSAVAYPSYQSYIQKSRRADAINALLREQAEQERWRATNSLYSATLRTQAQSPNGFYVIDLRNAANTAAYTAEGTGYTIRATAQGAQANDTACATILLRAGNHITSTNLERTPATCWSR